MTDKLTKIAICWITSAVLLYLGGSFAAASFDISTWSIDGRVIIVALWGMLAAAAVPAILVGGDFI